MSTDLEVGKNKFVLLLVVFVLFQYARALFTKEDKNMQKKGYAIKKVF